MTFPNNTLITAAELNGGAMVLLASAAPTANEPNITLSIPAGYPRLKVFWRLRGTASAGVEQLWLNINGDSSSDQLWQVIQGNNTSSQATTSGAATTQMQLGSIAAGTAYANYMSSGEFTVDGANDTTNYKTVVGLGAAFGATNSMYAGVFAGMWASFAQVSSLTLSPNSGDFIGGSTVSVWGLAA